MKKAKYHILTTLIIFIILKIRIPKLPLGDLFLAIPFTYFPDIDRVFKFLKHRNFLFHSILCPLFTLFGGFSYLDILLILSVGIHCLCDISLKTKGGFYCIYFINDRLNYKYSTLWLLLNGIISIIIFWWYI